MDDCRFLWLGTLDYRAAWALQKQLADAVHLGVVANQVLVLEHPHVYTIGRRGIREHIHLTNSELDRMQVQLHWVDRGGEVTYHGPGQMVVYPIVNLQTWGGPMKYVRTLEHIIIATLRDFSISAKTSSGQTGVWVGEKKIAAIGVKLSRGITTHGFSVNVDNDLSYYRHIVPCGIVDKGITSMAKELNEPQDAFAIARKVAMHFGQSMGFGIDWAQVEDIESILGCVENS